MKDVKEAAQEQGEEPVGHQQGCHQKKSPSGRAGHGWRAEVVRQVRGVNAHNVQQIHPQFPQSVQ